jgi:hypothetical protein
MDDSPLLHGPRAPLPLGQLPRLLGLTSELIAPALWA